MRRFAAIALAAVATTGCMGPGNAASPGGSSAQIANAAPPPPSAAPHTNVTITYTVPTCPPGAICAVPSNKQKYYIVSRHLTCSPLGGNYADANAACKALSDVVTKLGKRIDWVVCSGPGHPAGYIPAKAVGYYDGKRRTIPLDFHSLCNVPGVGADVALLTPGA